MHRPPCLSVSIIILVIFKDEYFHERTQMDKRQVLESNNNIL